MPATLSVNGFYKYQRWNMPEDDGFMNFSLHYDESNYIVQGSGKDSCGVFTVSGLYDGTNLRFIKQYVNCNGNVAWKYIGERVDHQPAGNLEEGSQQFVGSWGQGRMAYGEFVLSAVEKPEGAALPAEDRTASMPGFVDKILGRLLGEFADEVASEAAKALGAWVTSDLIQGFA